MAATTLALLCSVMWGTYDFGCGLLSRRASFSAVVLVGMGDGALAMLPAVILLHRPAPSMGTLAVLALGGVLVVRSGRIVRFEQFVDSAKVREAMPT